MDDVIQEFTEGIFALRTRRFGTVAEIMIKKLYGFTDSNSLAYDKIGSQNERIEVKFSVAMRKNTTKITEDNVIEQCIKANLANRTMPSTEAEMSKFDCNIQQIKPREFDSLYYGVFFSDQIEIFSMSSEEVLSFPGYSNKQHRGNVGEGQFHIKQDNIADHRKKYLKRILSYAELYDLLKQK